MKGTCYMLLLASCLMLAGCPVPPTAGTLVKDRNVASTSSSKVAVTHSTPRPGYVVGTAVFEDGTPIPKFKVRSGGQVLIDGEGVNGEYAIPWKEVNAITFVDATATFTYHNKPATLKLWPTDNLADEGGAHDFSGDTEHGVARDFVLKMDVPLPGQDPAKTPNFGTADNYDTYYGGTLKIRCDYGNTQEDFNGGLKTSLPHLYSPQSTLTVTLTPTSATRIDGLPAKTITRSAPLGSTWLFLFGIPFADYTLTAKLTEPGGATHALRSSLGPKSATDWLPSVPVVWNFWGDDGQYVETFTVYLAQ